MTYTAIDDSGRQVTLRKGRRCEWCGLMMPAGSVAVTRTYKCDGDFNDERMHPECYDAMGNYDGSGEGFLPYEMLRGRPGHRDWQCDQCDEDHADDDYFVRRGNKVLCSDACAAEYDRDQGGVE